MSNNAIGGYFQLELPEARASRHDGALKYHCARAAFLAVLCACKPQRVWMPYYICDSMVAQIEAAGAQICFYALDPRLGIADGVVLGRDDILLYVNYFGVSEEQVDLVLERFNPSQVVLDFSQSFYAAPRDCLATIYSPRKFFGLPDGGLLLTELPMDLPAQVDEGSEGRMHHLIKRLGGTPESGYAEYQHAESTLVGSAPKRMSLLTETLLAAVDVEAARVKRNENFAMLHAALGARNKLTIDPSRIDGPMCYPFLSDGKSFKRTLLGERIFVPTYWPEVIQRSGVPEFEAELVSQLHALPCDQRYGASDIKKIVDALTDDS